MSGCISLSSPRKRSCILWQGARSYSERGSGGAVYLCLGASHWSPQGSVAASCGKVPAATARGAVVVLFICVWVHLIGFPEEAYLHLVAKAPAATARGAVVVLLICVWVHLIGLPKEA